MYRVIHYSLLLVFIGMLVAKPYGKETQVMKWFDAESYSSLEIIKYKSISNHDVVKSVILTDSATIKEFIDRINKIPVDGDMMISFGSDAESVDLVFHNTTTVHTIELYNKRFKTPSTGFNSDGSTMEPQIYNDIDALLYPAIDKSILKVKGLDLKFDGFTLTYTGVLFSIVVKDKTKQTITINSVLTPPKPFEFKVNNKSYLLLTYESKKLERLYPNYFQITKK